jgi:hypothetical protein
MPTFPPQDRLIRKEVALGTIRELEPPQQHIGLQVLAPFMEVASDDVIFDYARGLTDGLAPARAEDAESELAQKDLLYGGTGRASVLDWALKDHYTPSDVTRYRESLLIQSRLGVNGIDLNLPTTIQATLEEFRTKLARDDGLRRRKLDNRIEWMHMSALETSSIVYNDGKIKFTVPYGRPGGQTDQAPAGGTWNLNTSDPIGAISAVQNFMFDTYGVRMTRAIASRKVLQSIINSDRFAARSGLVGGTGALPVDPDYLMDGWGPQAAVQVVERATNLKFIEYDAVYRTRPVGSQTITNTRFLSDKKVFFLPDPSDVDELDDAIGFGKTLTSPHPEGNWQPGFYEWENETTDPWGLDRGTGIKAFPVFPHMDWTYTMTVLP